MFDKNRTTKGHSRIKLSLDSRSRETRETAATSSYAHYRKDYFAFKATTRHTSKLKKLKKGSKEPKEAMKATNKSVALHSKVSRQRSQHAPSHPTAVYGYCQINLLTLHPTSMNPIYSTRRSYSLRLHQSTNVVRVYNLQNNRESYSLSAEPSLFSTSQDTSEPNKLFDHTVSYVSLMYYSAVNRNYCRNLENQ